KHPLLITMFKMPERCAEGIKKEENKLTKRTINLYQRCLTRILKKPWVVSGFRKLSTWQCVKQRERSFCKVSIDNDDRCGYDGWELYKAAVRRETA
ncbi:MAG: hypothetical protein LZF84_02950, partial [Nitrosomonas sp.]